MFTEINMWELRRLPEDMRRQLEKLEKNHPLLKAIEQYLLKVTRRRLLLQRTAEDTLMLPRKVWRWNGRPKPFRMFARMPRHLKSRITSGQTKVGFEGLKGALARWHNKGTKGQDGLKRPKRDFLGIGAADRREIESLINQHFS